MSHLDKSPAEVEGLVEHHQDKRRNLIINRASADLEQIINGHDPEVHHLGNRVWDRLDKMACEIEANHATALTALQADSERLKRNLHTQTEGWKIADLGRIEAETRAELAEAELAAWKAIAEKLALAGELLSDMIDVNLNGLPKSQDVWNKALASYEKLKEEVEC